MTDSDGGMHGCERRIHRLIRATVPAAVLAGVVAVAGCGGTGGSDSAQAPAPVKQASSAAGGVVTAEGTAGLVGSAGRASAKSQQFEDQTRKIPQRANQPTGAQRHGVAAGAACDDSDLMPSDSNEDQLNAAILCLVNAERAGAGLSALSERAQLDQAAVGMAKRMVTEQFFAHDTPDGKSVVDRVEPTGYIPNSGDWVVGENLAWGSGALSTPQAIVNGWMNSPGHKANILAPDYKDIGLAVAMGSPSPSLTGGTVYVNDFGAKSGADLNLKLPPESGASGSSAAAATIAGTGSAAKAKKAKHKRKLRRHRRRHRRH
jgi:uncharacterized protein YkwD